MKELGHSVVSVVLVAVVCLFVYEVGLSSLDDLEPCRIYGLSQNDFLFVLDR